jgi:murein L,D-transpeptidase YafK
MRSARRPQFVHALALGGLVATLVVGLSCGAAASPGMYEAGIPAHVRVDRLVVYKDDNRMEAYAGDALLRTYRVAVGVGGAGDKQYEGDNRTPVGTYAIDSRHRSRQFHRFLHVSYPNREDRRRYRAARRAGEVPEGRGIGSAIGIHGTPTSVFGLRSLFNWTAGCIAVSNEEAEELYRAVRDDAVIEVRP